MAQIIKTEGVINCDGVDFIDPYIDIYYLSYNGVAPIYAFPQIVTLQQNVLAQLFMVSIDADPMQTNRELILNIIIGVLENTYPLCKFTIVSNDTNN